MINRSISKIALTLALGVFASVSQAKPTAAEVVAATETAVAKAPDQAATIVEDQVKATPEFACDIIKAAVKAGKVSKQDESGLVAAALKSAPEKAPEIRACLAEQVAGGKKPVGGKEAIKEIVTDEDSGDYNTFGGVVGTYLAIPAGGTGAGLGPGEAVINGRVVSAAELRRLAAEAAAALRASSNPPRRVIIRQPVFVPGTGS